MLDGVTLDQLRTFIAAVDEGSFSAAGRKLRRAQSVVSQTLANLEAQLGVKLFDRSARYPQLTDEGRSLLVDARSVADAIDGFKARARAMREGLEPELAVAMDVMYPMDGLTKAASHSRKTFPHTSLRLYVEALGGVIKPVLDRTCNIGVIGSLPIVPDELAGRAAARRSVRDGRRSDAPAGGDSRRRLESGDRKARAARADRPDDALRGPRLFRAVPAHLASGRHGREARIPSRGPRLGTHASAHGAGGSRCRNVGQDPRRRHSAQHGHADEGGLPQGRAAGAGSARVHRSAEVLDHPISSARPASAPHLQRRQFL